MLLLAGPPVKQKLTRAGVPENERTYSSIWQDDAIGTGNARSVIDSTGAWSAKSNQPGEWIQMDLGQERQVAGTVIQCRLHTEQYVTEYTVSTSLDGKSWTAVPGKYIGDAKLTSENKFSNGALVGARYVRMIVTKWTNHISLRADVLIATGKYIRNDKQMNEHTRY